MVAVDVLHFFQPYFLGSVDILVIVGGMLRPLRTHIVGYIRLVQWATFPSYL